MTNKNKIEYIKQYIDDYPHRSIDVPESAEKCIDVLFDLLFVDMKKVLIECRDEIDCYIDLQYPRHAHVQFERKNAFLKSVNAARIALSELEGEKDD